MGMKFRVSTVGLVFSGSEQIKSLSPLNMNENRSLNNY